MIVDASPPPPPQIQESVLPINQKEIRYKIRVNSDTEISQNNSSGNYLENLLKLSATPQKLTLNDLKKDMKVTIYYEGKTDPDIELRALLIMPQPKESLPPPPLPIPSLPPLPTTLPSPPSK